MKASRATEEIFVLEGEGVENAAAAPNDLQILYVIERLSPHGGNGVL